MSLGRGGASGTWGQQFGSNLGLLASTGLTFLAVVHQLPIMDGLFAPFGVRIEASNSLVQAAFSAFLLVGIVAFAAPIISTIRVLLSLFVLPGKAVCAPHYQSIPIISS
jgi:hypothetical protein